MLTYSENNCVLKTNILVNIEFCSIWEYYQNVMNESKLYSHLSQVTDSLSKMTQICLENIMNNSWRTLSQRWSNTPDIFIHIFLFHNKNSEFNYVKSYKHIMFSSNIRNIANKRNLLLSSSYICTLLLTTKNYHH